MIAVRVILMRGSASGIIAQLTNSKADGHHEVLVSVDDKRTAEIGMSIVTLRGGFWYRLYLVLHLLFNVRRQRAADVADRLKESS